MGRIDSASCLAKLFVKRERTRAETRLSNISRYVCYLSGGTRYVSESRVSFVSISRATGAVDIGGTIRAGEDLPTRILYVIRALVNGD